MHQNRPTRARPTAPSRPKARGDAGAAATVSIVLMTPILVFICLAGFQAALWNHARAETRAIARTTAAAVARGDTSTGDARTDAIANLAANTDLTAITATVTTQGDQVVVTIRGEATGILIGTHTPITVTVALPIEGLRTTV